MKKDQIWIGIVCVILGIIIAFQFRIVQRNYFHGMSPHIKSTELINEVSQLRSQKSKLQSEFDELDKKLKSIEEAASSDNIMINKLRSDAQKYKSFSGLTDVSGEGIIITIDNPPKDLNYSDDINIVYDYELIINLVNELNSAGAEAIMINNQRLTSYSEIRAAGNSININTIPQSTPYIIKVIGNKDTLDGAINQRFGIVSTIRSRGYLVDTKKAEEVSIKKYTGITNFIYAKTKE